VVAVALSGPQHITNFTHPAIQSKIIGILWMIPIYSFNSVMSLFFPSSAVYIDMMRDCYEAYVLYLFFSLLLSFLCGGNEAYMIEYLETLPASKHPFPFNLCLSSYLPVGNDYLRSDLLFSSPLLSSLITLHLVMPSLGHFNIV
jgi:hypothetical protein